MAQLIKLAERMGIIQGALETIITLGNGAEVRARAASLGLTPREVADALDGSGATGAVTCYLIHGAGTLARARRALEATRADWVEGVLTRTNQL